MKNIKKIIILLLLIIIPFSNLKALEIKSNNAILYYVNDEKILLEKNTEEKIYIASLTKIMTVLVSLENIGDINEKVVFPRVDMSGLWDYSKVGFKVGEVLTYKDILYGTLLASGADAASALPVLVSDSKSEFISLMNKKVSDIGLKNTSFSNTIGIDEENNYSTVSDLLKLLNYALQNEEFYEMFTTKSYALSNGKIINSTLEYYSRKDGLDTTFIIGAKTGYTNGAGLCMASLFSHNDTKYILVTAGADYKTDEPLQVIDGINITEYYYENYEYVDLMKKNDLLTTITLNSLFKVNTDITAKKDVIEYLEKDKKIDNKYEGQIKLNNKNKVGDKIGVYKITYDGVNIDEIDIIIENNFKNKFWLFVNKYYYVGLIIVALLIVLKVRVTNKRKKNVIDNRAKTI